MRFLSRAVYPRSDRGAGRAGSAAQTGAAVVVTGRRRAAGRHAGTPAPIASKRSWPGMVSAVANSDGFKSRGVAASGSAAAA